MFAEQITIDEYMEMKKEYTEVVHLDSKGWITVANIQDKRYSQYHYRYDDLLPAVGENNYYVSMNTFYKPQRRIENIKELKNLYIDLDCYKTKYSSDAALYFLEEDYFNRLIPRPTMITNSGRGLNLVWNIESVPKSALPLWRAIENYFYKILKEFGADPKALDPTRILRPAGTINSKTNTAVEILDRYNFEYTLREIQDEYLPELKAATNKPRRAKGRPKRVVSLFNEYSLYYTRVEDIIRICELRKYDVKGMREHILFLYRYWTCCYVSDPREALRMTLELNESFRQPLSDREVERATESAQRAYLSKDKQYKYKNETLIEVLEISDQEQRELKSIIGTKEKYRRNNERRKKVRRSEVGLTRREQEKQNKLLEIKKFKEQGLNNAQIAKILEISIRQVQRLKKLI